MKKVLMTLGAIAVIVSVQSCKKCSHCQWNGAKYGDSYCESDNQAAYNKAKAECEASFQTPGFDVKWVNE